MVSLGENGVAFRRSRSWNNIHLKVSLGTRDSVRVLILWSPRNGFLHQASLGGGTCQGWGGGGMGEVMKVKLKRLALPSCEIQFSHLSNELFVKLYGSFTSYELFVKTISEAL